MAANYSLSCSASALPLQRYLDIDLVAMPTSKRHFLRPGNFGQCESCVWLHTVHAMWEAELHTVEDGEALRKIDSLRMRISEAAAALTIES